MLKIWNTHILGMHSVSAHGRNEASKEICLYCIRELLEVMAKAEPSPLEWKRHEAFARREHALSTGQMVQGGTGHRNLPQTWQASQR